MATRKNNPDDYEKFSDRKWQYAFGQHPMYLIILEDKQCAEREPPWGEPTIKRYIARMRRGLKALEKFPQLRYNFDFSSVELQDMAKRDPEVIKIMRKYLKQGRIEFHNGTYSQPHIYLYGSASCLRQFQLGIEHLQKIIGVKPVIFAAQEPCITYQLPQILKALGYKYSVAPAFVYRVEFLGPAEVLVYHSRFYHLELIHGKQWYFQKGLDGTRFPLYIAAQGDADYDSIKFEFQKDGIGTDNLKLLYHDLRPVDAEWVREQSRFADFVGLKSALEKNISKSPPQSDILLHPCWGYCEGVDGFVLKKAGFRAEQELLLLQSLAAYANLVDRSNYSSHDKFWETILTAQHHDANHAPVPELRPKAVGWLNDAVNQMKRKRKRIVSGLMRQNGNTLPSSDKMLLLFNGTASDSARVQKFVLPAAFRSAKTISLREPGGRKVACDLLLEWFPIESGPSNSVAYVEKVLPAFGFSELDLARKTKSPLKSSSAKARNHFENNYFRALFGPEGSFHSIIDKKSGTELLNTRHGLGNKIAGRVLDGSEVVLTAVPGKSELITGKVVTVLRAECKLGRQKAFLEAVFFNRMPRIDFRVLFIFDNASFGKHQIDSSKLNNYWPLANCTDVHHDVPFGHVRTRQGVPFFSSSWVEGGSENIGLLYMHHGTPKFYVEEGKLTNIWAWGKKGPDFTTRCHTEWPKDYDLRLNGAHMFEYSIVIRSQLFETFPGMQITRQIHMPVGAFIVDGSKETSVLQKQRHLRLPKNVICSEMVPEKGGAKAVVYEASGQRSASISTNGNIPNLKLTDLAEKKLTRLSPFQIGNLRIRSRYRSK